jgi:CheY-like chemotaxis protein
MTRRVTRASSEVGSNENICAQPVSFMEPDRKNSSVSVSSIYLSRESVTTPSQISCSSLLNDDVECDKFGKTNKSNVKILLVDDSPMNRKMLCRVLLAAGYKCEEASDGIEAVRKIETSLQKLSQTHYNSDLNIPTDLNRQNKSIKYNAILMDYMMPNMDGPTATREIKKLGFSGPIIGVTGNGLQEDQDLFLSAGATKVLIKPVSAELIEKTLQGS